MVENKKAMMIGLAAAGVVVSCAVIFKLWRGRTGEKTTKQKLVDAKLEEVKTDKDGKLDQAYFLHLLQFIGQETRKSTKDLREVNL